MKSQHFRCNFIFLDMITYTYRIEVLSMQISERIKYFRQMKNMTVNKLANKAGISQSYLRDLELGNKQPTVEYLTYICDALNISLKRFFTDDNEESEITKLIDELNDEQREGLINFLKIMLNRS